MKKHTAVVTLGLAFAFASGCAATGMDSPERVGTTASAITVVGSGYAWVTAGGVLGAPYSYDSSGGTIASARFSTGQYEVDFPGIAHASPTSAHVVAYGSNAHCKLAAPPGGTPAKTVLMVSCYTAAGALADSAFVVSLDERSGLDASPRGGGFFSVSGGTTPSIANSWSSAGGVNAVTWNASSQQYVATFPGLSFSNAGVHVTAIGATADRCKIVSWSTASVTVKCFDAAGSAVAADFAISYLERSLVPDHVGGHAWITGGAPGAGYSAAEGNIQYCSAPTFSTAPSGPNLTVSLTDSSFWGSPASDLFPMVTAYGTTKNYCNVVGWYTSGSTTSATVSCFDQAGTTIDPATTPFTISITNRSGPGPC
jgi:hypothetical protein